MLLCVFQLAGASAMVFGGGGAPRVMNGGHVVSGIPIRGAGVVPYVNLPGRGVHFLLQEDMNGTRMGKLCDFGGRREAADTDAYATAAREFCEETANLFGDESSIADSLRSSEENIRILNRDGRYVCFFHKVSYFNAAALAEVDSSSGESISRNCRWWRADELLGRVDSSQLLARMLTSSPLVEDLTAVSREPELSAFQQAVCKTLEAENANPFSHERWLASFSSEQLSERQREQLERKRPTVPDSTVLDCIAAMHDDSAFSSALARVAVVGKVKATRYGKHLAPQRPLRADSTADDSDTVGAKRGSRRGPPKRPAAKRVDSQWVSAYVRNPPARREERPWRSGAAAPGEMAAELPLPGRKGRREIGRS